MSGSLNSESYHEGGTGDLLLPFTAAYIGLEIRRDPKSRKSTIRRTESTGSCCCFLFLFF